MIKLMTAAEALQKTEEVIEIKQREEREAAEAYLEKEFAPKLNEAIQMGRSTLKLSVPTDVNAYTVSNILRDLGYKTRVTGTRNTATISSVLVFWNPEVEDDF